MASVAVVLPALLLVAAAIPLVAVLPFPAVFLSASGLSPVVHGVPFVFASRAVVRGVC